MPGNYGLAKSVRLYYYNMKEMKKQVDLMNCEYLSSRKNQYIAHLRALASDASYRREQGQYLCDGYKLLEEAVDKGQRITSVLWRAAAKAVPGLENVRQYAAPDELFDYASPMKNSPGPIFTLEIPEDDADGKINNALLLENVQDPGNVGTVIRTAAALGIDAVILCGACADVYSPKTARATMGAIFRQRIIHLEPAQVKSLGLPLIGAALSERAQDIRSLDIKNAVVAIGSEGRGLSEEMLGLCDHELIIPMTPGSESLNAAVAASLVMWEMVR